MARVIISIPDALLEELDRYAQEKIYNRSECVRHAVRLMVQGDESFIQKEDDDPEEPVEEYI